MKKDEMIISTLPIKPQKSTNIGMMIAPTIMVMYWKLKKI